MSPLLLMTLPGKQPHKYIMLNLIVRDLITRSFQAMIRCDDAKSDAQGSTFTDE